MTRGQIAIITKKDQLITSTEFNGDMYMSWHGKDVVKSLKKVKTVADYERAVKDFNDKNFHYKEKLTYVCNGKDMFDMNHETYFERWFSDYVYIKNLTNEDITIKDYKGKTLTIPTNKIAVMCFGELEVMA